MLCCADDADAVDDAVVLMMHGPGDVLIVLVIVLVLMVAVWSWLLMLDGDVHHTSHLACCSHCFGHCEWDEIGRAHV